MLVLEPLATLKPLKKPRPTKKRAAVAPSPPHRGLQNEQSEHTHLPILTLRVADFGLSQLRPSAGQQAVARPSVARHDSASDLFAVQGTYEYFAPELARLALNQHVGLLPKGYGPAVDDWAVGCIVFEMLAGDPPFGNHTSERSLFTSILETSVESLLSQVGDVSQSTLALIRGFLEHNPAQRLKCVDALQSTSTWASLHTGPKGSAPGSAPGSAAGSAAASKEEAPLTDTPLPEAVAKRREATGQHRTRGRKVAAESRRRKEAAAGGARDERLPPLPPLPLHRRANMVPESIRRSFGSGRRSFGSFGRRGLSATWGSGTSVVSNGDGGAKGLTLTRSDSPAAGDAMAAILNVGSGASGSRRVSGAIPDTPRTRRRMRMSAEIFINKVKRTLDHIPSPHPYFRSERRRWG